jgi:hypothetical protein
MKGPFSGVAIASLVCGLFGMPQQAHAEDFTIAVPVEVTNLASEIVSVSVGCVVCSRTPCSPVTPPSEASLIGSGQELISRTGDSDINAVVTIRINHREGKDPNDANYYGCCLRLCVQQTVLAPGPPCHLPQPGGRDPRLSAVGPHNVVVENQPLRTTPGRRKPGKEPLRPTRGTR